MTADPAIDPPGDPMTSDPATDPALLAAALAPGGLRTVFQPVVDLSTGATVGFEALVRGPDGPLREPEALFAAARASDRLAELDAACGAVAVRSAAEQGIFSPLTLFVNTVSEVLDHAAVDVLVAAAGASPERLRIVLEVTERSLAARPARLFAVVERLRAVGWGIALDDVGADSLSLALVHLLRPDVIKLDLAVVGARDEMARAEVVSAVGAYAARSGAAVLAEGVETSGDMTVARTLGATLGQGFLLGRPQTRPSVDIRTAVLHLPPTVLQATDLSPFSCLPAGTVVQQGAKPLLLELSRHLEAQAGRLGAACVVAATFQSAQFFTGRTQRRYARLAEQVGFVCALGEGLAEQPVPGVWGADLAPNDPVRGEWDVAVVGPHFTAALLAREVGEPGSDRVFEFAMTYAPDVVAAAARAIVSRCGTTETRLVPAGTSPTTGTANLAAAYRPQSFAVDGATPLQSRR